MSCFKTTLDCIRREEQRGKAGKQAVENFEELVRGIRLNEPLIRNLLKQKDHKGLTLLHYCAKRNAVEIAKSLLDMEKDQNLKKSLRKKSPEVVVEKKVDMAENVNPDPEKADVEISESTLLAEKVVQRSKTYFQHQHTDILNSRTDNERGMLPLHFAATCFNRKDVQDFDGEKSVLKTGALKSCLGRLFF